MFFPIRTDRALRRTPWVNYLLIAANVLVHVAAQSPHAAAWRQALVLDPQWPALWHGLPYPYLTYQFLHATWMHLIGNMVFLYVFGNSVEDRLGKFAYLMFYLAGGVLAGVGHTLVDASPVLGASGAVAAVTGAYLALFPLTNVTIVYFFLFIGTFEVSSMYLILFQIVENLFMQFTHQGGVAYAAHLAGYAYGFLAAMVLLWTRLLPREPYDLLALWQQHRRRAEFARLTRRGYQPWQGGAPWRPGSSSGGGGGGGGGTGDGVGPGAGTTNAPQGGAAGTDARQLQIMEMRRQIRAALQNHDLPGAAQTYQRLLALDPQQVLGMQEQLDLANQLTAQGAYDPAATTYELLLKVYPKYPQIEQVELLLGLIYTRYRRQPARAADLLNQALLRLTDPAQKELAQQLLAELR